MKSLDDNIKQFFSSQVYAVVGASNNRFKFGNKVLRCYLQHEKEVYPIHPQEQWIEGLACLPNIADLPPQVKSLSIITPPAVTEKIVVQAAHKGIQNIWMQPGAESETAINYCLEHQINLIAQGPCILVILGFNEDVS